MRVKRVLKSIAANWAPPILVKRMNRKNIFSGSYTDWREAKRYCQGYDAENILNKVLVSTLKVKQGEAVYERDSVLFDRIEYSWPVTAALMWIAARNNGRLNVLDFGGSLGSSFFQNRKFLQLLADVTWNVVEQKHYVDAGRKHIQDTQLRFYESIDDCLSENTSNVALLSGVLQYIPEPYTVLSKLTESKIENLVLDRTSFSNYQQDYIKIQHVPASIYEASYPCYFFNEEKMIVFIQDKGYELIEDFESLDKHDMDEYWRGHLFILRS